MTHRFTAIIEREDDTFVALCPELDIASQGETVSEARNNLREAIELFLEASSPHEIQVRLHRRSTRSNDLLAKRRAQALPVEVRKNRYELERLVR